MNAAIGKEAVTIRGRSRRAALRGTGRALVCLLTLLGLHAAATAASSTVTVERDGDRFTVAAEAVIDADPRTAWDTLTDYERLPQFIPGIRRTRVLSRDDTADGEQLLVEYAGRFNLLLLMLPTQVWLEVRHAPMKEVLARSVAPPPRAPDEAQAAPTLRTFTGRYTLNALDREPAGPPRVRLGYSARFELAEPLPPVIGPIFGAAAVRHALREQFEAMVAEIERRVRRSPAAEAPRAGGN